MALVQCTFYGNEAELGGAIYTDLPYAMTLENTIIAFSTSGEAIHCGGYAPTISCCNIFGNGGGDWVGCLDGLYGIDGNISLNPLFCDPEVQDFRLQEGSPCAPFTEPNSECDLIGAWPVGCGGTPTTSATWGAIKAMFR